MKKLTSILSLCLIGYLGFLSAMNMDIVQTQPTFLTLPDDMILNIFTHVYRPKLHETKPQEQQTFTHLKNVSNFLITCKKLCALKNKYYELFEPKNSEEAFFVGRRLRGEPVIEKLAQDKIDAQILAKISLVKLIVNDIDNSYDKNINTVTNAPTTKTVYLSPEDILFLTFVTLRFMKKNNYDVNVGSEKKYRERFNKLAGQMPLIEACRQENRAVITLLLKYGANVNIKYYYSTCTFNPLSIITDKLRAIHIEPPVQENLLAIESILLEAGAIHKDYGDYSERFPFGGGSLRDIWLYSH